MAKQYEKKKAVELGFVFGVLISSVSLFWIGMHNLDLGQNMRYLECEFGVKLIDTTLGGYHLTGAQGYSIGMAFIIISFYLFGLSMLALGGFIPKKT